MMRLFTPTTRDFLLFLLALAISLGALTSVRALLQGVSPVSEQASEIIPVGEEAEYYIVVDYVISNRNFMPPDIPLPPQGRKWLLVVMTFGNVHGASVTINENSLVLVDATGNRYLPLPAGQQTLHRVFGTGLGAGERVRGAVRFLLPNNVQAVSIAWCPQTSCDEPLEVPLP